MVELDLVLASRAKTITEKVKSSSRREKSVWSYLSHSMMDVKVVVLFLPAVYHK